MNEEDPLCWWQMKRILRLPRKWTDNWGSSYRSLLAGCQNHGCQRYFGRWKRIPLVVVLPKLDAKTKRLHIRNKFATSVVYWRRRNPMMKSESTWRSVWKSWIWSSLFTIDVILRCMWAIIATNLWKITNPIKQYVKEKSADCSQVLRRRWSCFVHATS